MRSRKETSASVLPCPVGEKRADTLVPAIGDFDSFALSVIANAAAVAASRARTTAVDRTRATRGGFYAAS
jgi:hypothetical protein